MRNRGRRRRQRLAALNEPPLLFVFLFHGRYLSSGIARNEHETHAGSLHWTSLEFLAAAPEVLCHLAQQSFFDVIQGLAHFHQDKFIRNVLIYLRHIPTEYCTIFFDQTLHVSDDFTAMCLQFLLFEFCHFILSLMFR